MIKNKRSIAGGVGILLFALVALFQNCSGSFDVLKPVEGESTYSASVPGDQTGAMMLSAATEDATVCRMAFEVYETNTNESGTPITNLVKYDLTIRPTPPVAGSVRKIDMPIPSVFVASRRAHRISNLRCPSPDQFVQMHYRVPYKVVCTLGARPAGEIFATKSFEYDQNAVDGDGNLIAQQYFFTDADIAKYKREGCTFSVPGSEGSETQPPPTVTPATGACTWTDPYVVYGVDIQFRDVQCTGERGPGWQCRYNGYPWDPRDQEASRTKDFDGNFMNTSYCKCIRSLQSTYNSAGTCQQPTGIR